MHRTLFSFLVALTLILPASAAPRQLTPVNLRCEYRTNPLGIDEPAPRLYWQEVSSRRGAMQSAYEILVASTPETLTDGRGDLWDSGRVASDECAHVVYRGQRLASGQRAWWKVRVWDERGRVSGYSRPAFWEMGLLQPSDWKAEWIGLPQPQAQDLLAGARWIWYPEGDPRRVAPAGTRYFRRDFTLLRRGVVRATLTMAVDNDAILYVNGREAGRAAGWQQAQAIDVAPLLLIGENALAIAATNADGPAGLLGRLRVEFTDGAPLILDVDRSWKTSTRVASGWMTPRFSDTEWSPALEIATAGDQPWGRIATAGVAPPCPYFRKEFSVRGPVRRARLYATALGVYEARINGRRVGDEVLAPGWTDYRKRTRYQAYDVTSLLQPGANVLGAILGDGWFAGSLGFDLSRNHFGPGPSRLRAQLVLEYEDGSRDVVGTDGTWRATAGPILVSDLYAGETYDARRELAGWDTAGGPPPGRWQSVTVYTDRNPEVDAQTEPPIRVTQELKPIGLSQPKAGVWVFDLGQNMVGWARLRVRGPAGTRVVMRFGEVLNPDGTVYRANLRLARATDTYVLSGRGEEVWEPHFTYHGFRYVEVTGYPGTPDPNAITGRVFHSAMTETSRFHSSSPLADRLFQNVLWGQRANLMSVPTDCPQRDERLGWMGDAETFARTACWNMDMAAFWSKWTRDIVDAQSPQGAFSDVSPRVVDMADGAPAWADAGIIIPWTVYECYGDRRLIERSYEPMRRYLDLLVGANPNLLWLRRRNNDFGDWVAAGSNTPHDLIASAFLAYDLRLFSRMAGAIGREEDARHYGELADRSRNAFNAAFLDASGRYKGDTQTAYAMALGMGLVPPDRREQVGARLAEKVREANDHLTTGFIGTKYLLPALSDTGHNDLAYRLLENTSYPSWGYMIGKGATTIWELWNSDTQGPAMNSRNHFAFGSVGEWMQRYLAGIDTDPDAPGYRRIVIRPRPGGDLTHARAEYDSLYGTIVGEWREDHGNMDLRVSIPANTRATVILPPHAAAVQVQEGRRTVWTAGHFSKGTPGVEAASVDADGLSLRIGSGEYEFRWPMETEPRMAPGAAAG